MCLTNCPEVYLTENNKCVSLCSEGKYILNRQCVDSCPVEYTINKLNHCISTLEKKCSDYEGLNNENNCVPCYEINGFILDKVCIKKCPEIYTVIQDGQYLKCILKLQQNKCDAFCNSNGSCSLLIDGKGTCSCNQDIYGYQCNLNLENYQRRISEINSSKEYFLLSINNNSANESIQRAISMQELSKDYPEAITDEILIDMIDLTETTLDEMNNEEIEFDYTIFKLIDSTFEAAIETNSEANLSSIKDKLNHLVDFLINKYSLNNYTGNNTSLIYAGSTYSIQVYDGSYNTKSESRENNLPLLNLDDCEKLLNQLGVINGKLYSINFSFDYYLKFDDNSTLSDGVISSRDKLYINAIDKDYNDIDISSCENVKVLFSFVQEAVNFTDYLTLMEEYEIDNYNSYSIFYNDVCFSYTSYNKTDYTLGARRDKYNISAYCSIDCTYDGIDEHSYSSCLCNKITKNKSISQYFGEAIYDSLIDTNFYLLKCYIPAFENVKDNVGFWSFVILTILSSVFLLFLRLFYKNGAVEKDMDAVLYNDAEFGIKPRNTGNIQPNNNIYPDIKLTSEFATLENNNNTSIAINDILLTTQNKFPSDKSINKEVIGLKNSNSTSPLTKLKAFPMLNKDNTIIHKVKFTNPFNHNQIIKLKEIENNNEDKHNEMHLKENKNTFSKIKEEQNKTEFMDKVIKNKIMHENNIKDSKVIPNGNDFSFKFVTEIENKDFTDNHYCLENNIKENNDQKLNLNELEKETQMKNISNRIINNPLKVGGNFISSFNNFINIKENNLEFEEECRESAKVGGSNDAHNLNINNFTNSTSKYDNSNRINSVKISPYQINKKNNQKNKSLSISKTMLERKKANRSNNTASHDFLNLESIDNTQDISKLKKSHTNKQSSINLNSMSLTETNFNNSNSTQNKDTSENSINGITLKDIKTLKDFEKLPLNIQLQLESKSYLEFFLETILYEHKIISLFSVKSLINPLWIRIISSIFEYSLDFALNGIYFTSDYINAQRNEKENQGADAIGAWYIITNEFWKSFWPVVISLIICLLLNMILKIPELYMKEFNEALKTKNKSVIIES